MLVNKVTGACVKQPFILDWVIFFFFINLQTPKDKIDLFLQVCPNCKYEIGLLIPEALYFTFPIELRGWV